MGSEAWLTAAKLVAVIALVLANGFFVAAEFALVAIRRSRVEELVAQCVLGAKAVQRAIHNLDHFIAATQLGITLASLALGWLGEPTIGHLLERVFGHSPTGTTLALINAFTIITALHIVIGELAPKSIALQYPERTSLLVAQPLGVFDFVFRPFIVALNGIGRRTVRLLGLRAPAGHELVHSTEELKLLVEASGKAGVLEETELQIIDRAFDFAEFTAHEAMTPRTEVVSVAADTPGPELLDLVCEAGFSRYPVCGDSQDEVIGVLHAKDLLAALRRAVRAGDLASIRARDLVRAPLLVPETLPADELLERMRTTNTRLAMVIDEFGGLAGIVTLASLVERLLGPLHDEFEADATPLVEALPDGSALIDGLMLLSDVNQRFGLALDESEYDTLGGYVFGQLGRLPAVGDTVVVGDYELRVAALDARRVARVRLSPQPARTSASNGVGTA